MVTCEQAVLAQASELHNISGLRSRVQKVKPKMAGIDVQFQFLSIVFICAVKHQAVSWQGENFLFLFRYKE